MEVEVRIQDNNLQAAAREYVVRRVRFAMGRFGAQVGRVVIRTYDVNGTRGGVDQCCHITAELLHAGKVVVEQVDANLLTAVDRACERVGQASRREIERMRDVRTRHESVRLRS